MLRLLREIKQNHIQIYDPNQLMIVSFLGYIANNIDFFWAINYDYQVVSILELYGQRRSKHQWACV